MRVLIFSFALAACTQCKLCQTKINAAKLMKSNLNNKVDSTQLITGLQPESS